MGRFRKLARARRLLHLELWVDLCWRLEAWLGPSSALLHLNSICLCVRAGRDHPTKALRATERRAGSAFRVRQYAERWNPERNARDAIVQVLSTLGGRYAVVEPTVRRGDEPLRPRHHQRRDRATVRRRTRLHGVLSVREGGRRSPKRLRHQPVEKREERWMGPDAQQIAASGSSLHVPASYTSRRRGSHDMESHCSQTAFSQILPSQTQPLQKIKTTNLQH